MAGSIGIIAVKCRNCGRVFNILHGIDHMLKSGHREYELMGGRGKDEGED